AALSMYRQPHARVASTATAAPRARAASAPRRYGATAPSADWTRLNTTRSVASSTASARSDSGTVRATTPRWACAIHGNRAEVNSPVGATTRAPSGSAAATGANSCETVAPTATSATGTPVGERPLELLPRRPRRQAVAGRVEVARLGVPQRPQLHRHLRPLPRRPRGEPAARAPG